jgi:uncharacterized membrane protein
MLGSCLAITTFVRRAPLKILAGASIAILALHPLLVHVWTDRLDTAGVTIKLLHQAGRFPGLDVYYPLIPWIGIMLLGVVTGRLYVERGARGWGIVAGIFGVAFLITRFTGLGSAAGFDGVLSYSFFTWSKYPPDLPWLSASFAVLFATLALLERLQHRPLLRSAIAEAVATFGRVPLFFYVLHFAVLWFTRPREPRHLAAAFAVWGVLLVLMWWPCRLWYEAMARKRRLALSTD